MTESYPAARGPTCDARIPRSLLPLRRSWAHCMAWTSAGPPTGTATRPPTRQAPPATRQPLRNPHPQAPALATPPQPPARKATPRSRPPHMSHRVPLPPRRSRQLQAAPRRPCPQPLSPPSCRSCTTKSSRARAAAPSVRSPHPLPTCPYSPQVQSTRNNQATHRDQARPPQLRSCCRRSSNSSSSRSSWTRTQPSSLLRRPPPQLQLRRLQVGQAYMWSSTRFKAGVAGMHVRRSARMRVQSLLLTHLGP